MKIRDQEIMLPTSMVGNYPNPRWWDSYFARYWTGDQRPPDSLEREALEDAVLAIAHDQELAGLDIITDGRLHADNYGDQALYYYYVRLGYDLKGGYLGFPIYSRLHAGTLAQEVRRRGAIMVEQAKALKKATNKPTKVQYTGIQVLGQATNDLHYKSSRDRAMDIAKAINEDILEVDALGVDFIQLDEFTWPYGFEDWAIEAFNRWAGSPVPLSGAAWWRGSQPGKRSPSRPRNLPSSKARVTALAPKNWACWRSGSRLLRIRSKRRR